MKFVFKYFLRGLLYIVPLAVTIYVIVEAFVMIDSLLPFEYPGAGILALFILISAVGLAGSIIVTNPLKNQANKVLNRAPLVKTIYTAVRDLVSAFVGKQKSFTEPVRVRVFENSKVERIGFVTDRDLKNALNISDDLITVYVPHSYAFSGQLFMVPSDAVTPLTASASSVMKYIISGGVSQMESNQKIEETK
ncbi:MAG: putative membrane protein [Candidatus Azotimanducaceae bacterium]|jgi:uncharacterized membrane protein